MAVIRLEALRMLASYIEAEIPELDGKVCPTPAEPNHRLDFPHLVIVPVRFEWSPEQADEWHVIDESSAVYEVGKHEAQVQLRLGARNFIERVTLEDKILQLFMGQIMSPGVITTTVVPVYDALVAWELDDQTWEDEAAWDSKWYSTILVNGQIPALVTRTEVYDVTELQLGLSEDFNTEHDENTFNTSPNVEVLQVNDDGTLTPV